MGKCHAIYTTHHGHTCNSFLVHHVILGSVYTGVIIKDTDVSMSRVILQSKQVLALRHGRRYGIPAVLDLLSMFTLLAHHLCNRNNLQTFLLQRCAVRLKIHRKEKERSLLILFRCFLGIRPM